MKLKKLTLSNFRGFEDFECEFQENINVLVGLNGYGKSSVLDAISIAYGQFISGFETGLDKGVHDDDIHLAKHSTQDGDFERFSMESQFPVKVQAEAFSSAIDLFPQSWGRSRNTRKGRTTQVKQLKDCAKDLQQRVQQKQTREQSPTDLPLLSYYGTGRLWKHKKLTSNKAESANKSSRLEGYRDCLDPESSYAAFSHWLRNETIADHERRMQVIEESGLSGAVVTGTTFRSTLLAAISTAVNKVLEPSGWSNVRYSATTKQITATHEVQGNVPVSMLSDGVRNMIGMIADIAYRAVRLNPHFGQDAVIKTQGIVLIDEVDMHLHPEWQQLVLQNLSEAFPNIQFIVTTHSPQVLSSVKKESILLLGDNAQITPVIGDTYGTASGDILTEIMGVNPRPRLDWVVELEKYSALIDSGLYASNEGKALRASLEEKLGAEHDGLQKADRKIRRKGLLSS